jgi:hypothetical protein
VTSEPTDESLTAWLALTAQTPPPQTPVVLPMLTGSMRPTLPVGSRLLIAAGSNAGLQPGAVVVFRDGERLVAHRVLLVLHAGPWSCLLEKGDANAWARWRRSGAVCGRVIGLTLSDGTELGDPADPVAASNGLRCHLRSWLLKLVGRRAAPAED